MNTTELESFKKELLVIKNHILQNNRFFFKRNEKSIISREQ